MRNNKILFALAILIVSVSLCGCNANISNNEENNTTESVEKDIPKETPEKVQDEVLPKSDTEKYVPDKESGGYFSLIDEGLAPEVKKQKHGTCWTNAATSSMEGVYFKQYQEKISIDATDLCLSIFDDEKEEGWFVKKYKLDIGGWDWMVCGKLASGYDGYYLKHGRRYNEDGDEHKVKDAIKQYGPLTVEICDNGQYQRMFHGYFTMNDNNFDNMDHEVIIIGWDDNFPKDYFQVPAKNNGAWLCQNSDSVAWGNEGTYWVSYESLVNFQLIYDVTKEYSDVAYYDCGNEKCISTGETCTIANVFHKKGTLAAVGTYTQVDNQEYTIEIYDDNFEEKLACVDGVKDIKGYHVVDLKEPLEVEDFAVVISYHGQAPVEGESVLMYDDYDYRAVSHEGESFVLYDDKWLDLSLKSTKEQLALDFMPNNACIKALYK